MGVRLIVHEVLGSTNAEALKLARDGERGPLWIVAKRQTAGRGRRGRDGYRSRAISLQPSAHDKRRPASGAAVSVAQPLRSRHALIEIGDVLKPRVPQSNDLLLDGINLPAFWSKLRR